MNSANLRLRSLWLPAVVAAIITAAPAGTASAGASTENVVAKVLPSVVTVRTPGGLGSAFAFGRPGQFITNLHVVQGYRQVILSSSGGVDAEGRVTATDSQHDLAAISAPIRPNPLLAAPNAPKVGADVLSIGSPLGLDGSVSKGIISAVDRRGNDGASIQTSIALNPGNSGGPLINTQGQVIGVNTSIADASQGIGFAVPIRFAERLTGSLPPLRQSSAPEAGSSSTTLIAGGAALLLIIVGLAVFLLVRHRREHVKVKIKSDQRRRFRKRKATPGSGEEIVIELRSKSTE